MIRILIVILFVLTCCTGDKKQTVVTETNSMADNDFIKFVSLLPKLKLPFEVNCEKCCDHPKIDYDNELVKKFNPEGSAIVGLIEKTSDRVVILVTYSADMIIPSVKVYDLEGKLTGQMNFMTGYCGGDFEYYASQFFRVRSGLSFSSIDTSYYLKMDTVHFEVIARQRLKS